MTINRVQGTGFAQIANTALRDKRLSFRARGVLAMVLSYSGEWDSPRDWLESMSDKDGREAIQSALNELTDLGYRTVVKQQNDSGQWRTEAHWFHTPGTDVTEGRVSRPPGKPSVGKAVLPPEDHLQNTEHSPQAAPARVPAMQFALMPSAAKPVSDFAAFWAAYPRKVGKKAALAAYKRALKDTTHATIIAAIESQGLASREAQFIPHPTTWLNQGRWDDETPQHGVSTGPLGMPDWNFKEEPIDYAAAYDELNR